MSKRNKPWWKEKEKIDVIDNIQFIARNAESKIHRQDAQSFLDYFTRVGYLTPYMKSRGRELTKLLFPERLKSQSSKPKPIKGKHYLYAVSDGEYLKVGYSLDPKKRLKAFKTGSARPLKLVWQVLCGYDSKQATKEEKKLHRRLKPFHVNGEWFDHDCILICRGWRILHIKENREEYENSLTDEEANIELDKQMLSQINNF